MSDEQLDLRPLAGLRVIEIGQLLAGPFTGTILGYFGAEVIKVEPPEVGDPIRGWREVRDGTSLWWASLSRNKKCITLDLKTSKGQEVLKKLANTADVFVENFRPGTMEKWGIGPDTFKEENPGLIYARISGYGQTGPAASKAGFASVCEAFGGFRYVNGFPGEVPVRPNISIGDTLAGIHAALGVLLAYIGRQKSGQGQVVDVAIFEGLFNLLEAVIPEYSGAGIVREPSGTAITGIVPTNTHRCKDGKHIVIGANTNSMFKRLAKAMDKPEMGDDSRFTENTDRVANQKEIETIIESWTLQINSKEAIEALDVAGVAAGPIYSVKDMFEDEQYRARELFQEVSIDGKPLTIPAIIPRLSRTPGKTDFPGSKLGAHNEEVLQDILGYTEQEIAALKAEKII
jgi:crotonobetainyl-CoA:carnitine CoA-transferase CaiB-like acyl-CoA transferase|tara:strand:- start:122 stop:1327 length:1206 start_codon:yes stop_codon:yes gene_type:complete